MVRRSLIHLLSHLAQEQSFLATERHHFVVILLRHTQIPFATPLPCARFTPTDTRHTRTHSADSQQMSIRAMRFSCITGRWTRAAKNILAVSDRFKMCRIDTIPSFTQMVNFFSFGHIFNKQRIHPLVGFSSEKINLHLPVSIRIKAFLPIPTRRTIIEMFVRYFNSFKQTGKNLGVESDRIKIRHSVKESPLIFVIRGLSGMNDLSSPASILA